MLKTSLLLALAVMMGHAAYFSGEEEDSDEHGQNVGKRSTSCPCGWTNKARIVGGKETLKNEFPLIAGIMDDTGELFCGGAIVTHYHVLTAAHCTHPFEAEDLQIIVGAHDITEENDTGNVQIIPVMKKIVHKQYHKRTYSNDISLLVVAEKFKYNQFVGPVCLPPLDHKFDYLNEWVKVIGWGKLSDDGDASSVLMKVNLKVIPAEKCAANYRFNIPTGEKRKQLCTYRTGKDSCRGDSGGPVVWLDPETNRYTQAGLVSFGKVCASNTPAVNTDVAKYILWIEENVKKSTPAGADGVEVCRKI